MTFKLRLQGGGPCTGWARRATLQIEERVPGKAWAAPIVPTLTCGILRSAAPLALLNPCNIFHPCVENISTFLSSLSETPNHLSLMIRVIFKNNSIIDIYFPYWCLFLMVPQQMITTEIYCLKDLEA